MCSSKHTTMKDDPCCRYLIYAPMNWRLCSKISIKFIEYECMVMLIGRLQEGVINKRKSRNSVIGLQDTDIMCELLCQLPCNVIDQIVGQHISCTINRDYWKR